MFLSFPVLERLNHSINCYCTYVDFFLYNLFQRCRNNLTCIFPFLFLQNICIFMSISNIFSNRATLVINRGFQYKLKKSFLYSVYQCIINGGIHPSSEFTLVLLYSHSWQKSLRQRKIAKNIPSDQNRFLQETIKDISVLK